MHWHSLDFLISPLLAYVFGAASPGPANFATMTTSLEQGRRAGLIFALGVFSGSIFWGLLAILGLGAVMTLYSEALTTLKIIGGAYLLWLGIKSARSALRPSVMQSVMSSGGTFRALFFSGLALHLTNPKPILTWTAVVSLGLQADAGIWHGLAIVAVCGLAGLVIFSTYAIVFSTHAAQRGFGRARRGIDGVLAVIYAGMGLGLIVDAVAPLWRRTTAA